MKRLVLCCDGTWQYSDQKYPTNVALLSRAIKPRSTNDNPAVEQPVYYQTGVGASSNEAAHLIGGLTGQGVPENVRDAYLFFCLNWYDRDKDGKPDEIYIFGFSRGAYIARATAGLVCQFGLLTKEGIDAFRELYEYYINNKFEITPTYLRNFDAAHPNWRVADVKVKFVGVWDTVGSLGTPDLYIFNMKPPLLDTILQETSEPHQFGQTDLLPQVEFAYQALALNEERHPYSPALWWVDRQVPGQKLKQVWFSGVHSSCGGGLEDYALPDIALAWMVQKIHNNTGLECDIPYLAKGIKEGMFGRNDLKIPWGLGSWTNPTGVLTFLGGQKKRTPGQYENDFPARKTFEFVHKSVKRRQQSGKYSGPDISRLGVDDSDDEIEKQLSW